MAAEEKITAILEAKVNLIKEASELRKTGDMSALALQSSLREAREVAMKEMNSKDAIDDNDKVSGLNNRIKHSLRCQLFFFFIKKNPASVIK